MHRKRWWQAFALPLWQNPDSVLRVLDKLEASRSKELPDYQISLLRGMAYNEKHMYSLVEKICRTYVGIRLHQEQSANKAECVEYAVACSLLFR